MRSECITYKKISHMKPLHYLFKGTLVLAVFILQGQSALCQLNADEMLAHYIDVGQANATLLEFPCGAVLIDAGAQDKGYADTLLVYLDAFFARRTDLSNTISLAVVTHCHKDHNSVLKKIMERYKVLHYVDNGYQTGSGRANQVWAQNHSPVYMWYLNEEVVAKGHRKGFTDATIDPLNCAGTDPVITILSSSFEEMPASWSGHDFKNGNNHSIVLKVDFGKSSMLFVGDLEEAGIGAVLREYRQFRNPVHGNPLDADVLLVGHHGSYNATTTELLEAVTPSWAVISCGKWDYGLGGGMFNTYSYGHPRIAALDLLSEGIREERDSAVDIKAAVKAKKFTNYIVTQNIYGTAWDGDILLRLNADGTITKQD